ncbi:MAG: ATP-binding protein [Chloroflexota bacterium]
MGTMIEETTLSASLRPRELEAVYEISRVVAASEDIDTALDQIAPVIRQVFIFDNMVLYLKDLLDDIEPTFARVVGRGRSASEDDVAWGEGLACAVLETGQLIQRTEESDGWETNRLAHRFFLGLPLQLGEKIIGAVVFGRFGGPAYTPEQIHLAEFTAAHVAQLFGRQQMVERIARLEAEKRLNAMQSDFIAMVSHEFGTPLGFIKGYATTLLRDDISWDDSTRREFLTIIDEEADRLQELISSLLDSSQLQAGTMKIDLQPVRLDTLIRDVVLRAKARYKELSIQVELLPNAIVQVDPTRLSQVFDNLLSNAVKYAPGAPVAITMVQEGDITHTAVQDAGPGIDPTHVEHLFERFYRVPTKQNVARGTGLGLFICRQLVQAHQGTLTVESVLGQGTTFHIYLPSPGSIAKP